MILVGIFFVVSRGYSRSYFVIFVVSGIDNERKKMLYFIMFNKLKM